MRIRLQVFKDGGLQRFCLGRAPSLLGVALQAYAWDLLVTRLLDQSPRWVTVAFLCSVLPLILFSYFGGSLADRHPKRQLLVWYQLANSICSLVLAALCFTGEAEVWHVVSIAAAASLISAIEDPTRHAFMAALVEQRKLQNALVIDLGLIQASRILGPFLGAWLLSYGNYGWAFLVNGATYLLFALAVIWIGPIGGIPNKPGRRRVWDGILHIVRSNRLVILFVLAIGLYLFSTAYLPSRAIFAFLLSKDAPWSQGYAYAWLTAAYPVGALAGLYLLAVLQRHSQLHREAMIAILCAGHPICVYCFCLSQDLWISTAMLAVAGGFGAPTVALMRRDIFGLTPPHLHGAVMGVLATIFLGTAPIGGTVAGALAGNEPENIRWTVAAFALCAVLICLVSAAALIRCGREAPDKD